MTWHCSQIPNGSEPLVVCERDALLTEIAALLQFMNTELDPSFDGPLTAYIHDPKVRQSLIDWAVDKAIGLFNDSEATT